MRTTCTVQEPAVLARCGLSQVFLKLIVALDEAFESVPDIGGVDRVGVGIARSESSHQYHTQWGSPLIVAVRLKNQEQQIEWSTAVDARVYADSAKDNEAVAWVETDSMEGTDDEVTSWIARDVVAKLQVLQSMV